MNKAALVVELTKIIIEKLNIEHCTAEDVDPSIPLFSPENPLELDSIDAIEIIVQLKENYGVRITDEMPAREILHSIESIADFLIQQNATVKLT